MITFFEITGYNPRYASKNPTALVEKRIEDLERMQQQKQKQEPLSGMEEKMTLMEKSYELAAASQTDYIFTGGLFIERE